MRRKAPRSVRLEHVVLQHEVACVSPVVRDLARVVVAHHLGAVARAHAERVVPVEAAERPAHGRSDEAVHRPLSMSRDALSRACGPPKLRSR